MLALALMAMVLSAATPSPAQDSPGAAAPSPFPIHPLALQGDWSCAGQFRGGALHRSMFKVSSAVGGTWFQLDERDVQPATGYVATYLLGYDKARHRLVEFDSNNSGAGTYFSDTGWTNGVLTMTSDPSDDDALLYDRDRFVYTVVSEDAFSIDWQVQKKASLGWLEGDHLACRRVGALHR